MKKLSERNRNILWNEFGRLVDHFIVKTPHPEHGWVYDVQWSDTHELPMLADHTYKVHNTMNGSNGDYSAICLSYALNIMACNRICWQADSVGSYKDSQFWARLQYQIRNKYLRRKEKDVGQLLSFID